MSDAISYARQQQGLWDTARRYTCMYFGVVPLDEEVTKEDIEKWLAKYNRTPESTKEELTNLNLFWWYK